MRENTAVNPYMAKTEVNTKVEQATVINTAIPAPSHKLKAGVVLAEKYKIVRPLKGSAGEADLYICQYDGCEYVIKLYRRRHAIKPEVVEVLRSINSPYVAHLIDVGVYDDHPFEVLPYYKNGSLHGKTFTLEQLKENIIPSINQALFLLHQKDIIHKDLKPSNIMLLDDGEGVAIIDFGISSMIEDGNTVLITKTGMTPEYSAPETFKNLFLEESDYYSFGITVFELFCGHTPYENMSAEEIARFTAVQRIPFPEDMPKELVELISALTYFDITNRNKKNNPNRRWTYHEVLKWCEGEKQVIPGEGVGFSQQTIPEYIFMNKKYTDVSSLSIALATNWNEGKKQLFSGLLSAHFERVDPTLSGFCRDAEKDASRVSGKDDIIFYEFLYKLNPELKGFYFMGQTYESISGLGRDMLERLWKNDVSRHSFWDGILSNRLLSKYLEINQNTNQDLSAAVSAVEAAHNTKDGSKRASLMNYYTVGYLLSGQKLLFVDGKHLKSVEELVSYMKQLLDVSYNELRKFCHKMINYDDTLDVQLEAWLIAIGKRNELELWRAQLEQ